MFFTTEENEDTLRRVSLAQGRLRKPGLRGRRGSDEGDQSINAEGRPSTSSGQAGGSLVGRTSRREPQRNTWIKEEGTGTGPVKAVFNLPQGTQGYAG